MRNIKKAVNDFIYSATSQEEKIMFVELKMRAIDYRSKKPSAQVAIFEYRPCNLCGELNVENVRVVALFADDDIEILENMYEVFGLEKKESKIDFHDIMGKFESEENFNFMRFNSHREAGVPKRKGLRVWDDKFIEADIVSKKPQLLRKKIFIRRI